MLEPKTATDGPPPAAASPMSTSMLRVLLIDDSSAGEEFCVAISLSGHTLVARASTAEQALSVVAGQEVNAAVLVLPFAGETGGQLCRQLQLSAPIPVVLVADSLDAKLFADLPGTGIVGCVARGASVASLSAALSVGATWFTTAARLRAERDELAAQNRQLIQTLENRKVIERAKGIYMRLHGLQEAEAHRRLQVESQKRRLAIADLARKIIESDELLGRG